MIDFRCLIIVDKSNKIPYLYQIWNAKAQQITIKTLSERNETKSILPLSSKLLRSLKPTSDNLSYVASFVGQLWIQTS